MSAVIRLQRACFANVLSRVRHLESPVEVAPTFASEHLSSGRSPVFKGELVYWARV